MEELDVDDVGAVVKPKRRWAPGFRHGPAYEIRAVFPAVVACVSRDHVHLANYLSAFEFDLGEWVDGLQAGLCYVFQAKWESASFVLNEDDEKPILSLEQMFDPNFDGYHELSRAAHGPRHRWNGHFGDLKKVGRLPKEAVGEMMMEQPMDRVRLAAPSGAHVGISFLPHGCYSFEAVRLRRSR